MLEMLETLEMLKTLETLEMLETLETLEMLEMLEMLETANLRWGANNRQVRAHLDQRLRHAASPVLDSA
jgi:exonuclease V gamma subunit